MNSLMAFLYGELLFLPPIATHHQFSSPATSTHAGELLAPSKLVGSSMLSSLCRYLFIYLCRFTFLTLERYVTT